MGADDAPGAMLPDGHFLFLADHYVFKSPTKMFDFDYTTNSLTDITSTLPQSIQSSLASGPAYSRRMLVLPNGHLMLDTGTYQFWDYAPSGAPQSSWQPTIAGIVQGTGSNSNVYTLTGTRLTGISQGASYGDDVECDTNYPIVQLTGPSPGTAVHYARTTNWTPGVSKAGSTTSSTVQFTLPANLANGTYTLKTIANGIASAGFSFKIPFTSGGTNNYVSANYNPSTLTLTLADDSADNSVSVSVSSGQLTVTGNGNTRIGNSSSSAQSVKFHVGAKGIVVNAGFTNGGNNTFTMTGVKSSTTTIQFGAGNDSATLTLCNINTLSVNGGAGTDSLSLVSSVVKKKTVQNVP
jgi:hypothetical protein